MDSVDSRDEESPLVVSDLRSNKNLENHTRDVHILSCAFLLIFLAYGATQNLESTVNTEEDLGTISLGILYLSFTIFSLFASLVVRMMGSKNSLLLGTTGYWLFMAANLNPSWFTMVPASVYLGFAASVIWVGQGTYLTTTARNHSNDCNLHEGTVIGNFNGEFWGMFAAHQFVGNLITLALLKDGKEGSAGGTTLLFIVFLSSMTLGTILMCFLQKRDGKCEEGLSEPAASIFSYAVSLTKSVITPLFDVRMLLIIPLFVYSGLQQAFVWAEFTKYIVTPALGVSGVGGSMAVFGAFDAVATLVVGVCISTAPSERTFGTYVVVWLIPFGISVSTSVFNSHQCSLAAGRLTSGLSSITWIVSGGALAQVFVMLWILLKYRVTSGLLGTLYPLLMAAIWGIGDGVLNTQINGLIGILFKNDTEGAFAQYKVWQSASISAVFFLSPYITMQAMLVIMLASLFTALSGFLFLTLKAERACSSSTSHIISS